MSYTLAPSPLVSPLLSDPVVEAAFSAEADIACMLRFEAALAAAEAAEGVVPAAAADAIRELTDHFRPDMAALAAGVETDGLVVPAFVRQLKSAAGPDLSRHIHVGATSQDLLDTSLVLRLATVLDHLDGRLRALVDGFDSLAARDGRRPMMARTRMQDALPITAADRIALWRSPLAGLRSRLAALRPGLLRLQFAGAVGTLDGLAGRGAAVRARLAALLGLADPGGSWQTDRAAVAEAGLCLALVAGALGKFGQDVALMAQDGTTIVIAGGGGSSAMPHKRNPVRAEILVALARFAAVQSGGLGQSLVHEQERSGAAWTLEFLLLPQLALAAGAATGHAAALLSGIERVGQADG